jgi:hypothetical protein
VWSSALVDFVTSNVELSGLPTKIVTVQVFRRDNNDRLNFLLLDSAKSINLSPRIVCVYFDTPNQMHQ